MPKARQLFRRTDLTRAIKGAVAAGVEVMRAEIDSTTGKIVLVLGKSGVASSTADNGGPGGWDHI